jgi:hypothetical protein
MKKATFTFIIIFLQLTCLANDGAFFAKGNQLIPINESEISVKKEILTLQKIRHDFIEVTVYYEFFNPNDDKIVIVGFEAFSPLGDVNGAPKNGLHPYMNDFTVEMNDTILKYDVSYVKDSLYNNSGRIESIDLNTFEGETHGNYVDFYYVYHFNATFKKGINIIKHTYKYDLSGGICYNYNFEYVLTAANRWSNKQIDDFTLIIDAGEFESFNIEKSFFKESSDWLITGIGKTGNTTNENKEFATFNLQKGSIIFQSKNFKPSGELYINSLYCSMGTPNNDLPFSYYVQNGLLEPTTEFSKKAFKNLPFARRGYIFKNKELQKYFEGMSWYIPNPNYIPDVTDLHILEKKWIEKYK